MSRRVRGIAVFTCLSLLAGGCFKKPDKANIDLRKKNQELEKRVADLQRLGVGDAAMVRSLQEQRGTLPTLPRDRLVKLFTTHDLKLGKLTGGADLDTTKPGQEGLKIYATPLDQAGDTLKAAGAFTVEAFDLSRDQGGKVGTWTFDVAASRDAWSSVLNRYNYVLACRWQTPPTGKNLHVEISFLDELTQATFRKTLDVTIDPPSADRSTHPSTIPSASTVPSTSTVPTTASSAVPPEAPLPAR